MELKELCKTLKLNKRKISRFAYKSDICTDPVLKNNKALLVSVLRQMAINIHVVYRSYDKMPIDEVDFNVRKNGILAYMGDLYPKTTNRDLKASHIEKNLRLEGKSKLLWYHNELLRYVNSNTK